MDLNALSLPEAALRLGISFVIGALIGLERERHQRPAGLRTHILVTLASALFAMVSIVAAGQAHDPGRIAAQVVTGIGFLGAGTIMRHGSTVKGLTTAASLWTAAALGLAVGFGWHIPALMAAVLAVVTLTAVKHLEEALARRAERLVLTVTGAPGLDPLPQLLATVRAMGAEVQAVQFGPESVTDGLHLTVTVLPTGSLDRKWLTRSLQALEAVRDVEPG